MSFVRVLIALIEALQQFRKEMRTDIAQVHKEALELHREIEHIRHQNNRIYENMLSIKVDTLELKQNTKQIVQAIVPEPVTQITLETETGDHMDITVGQTSTLTFQALGASGNPTVPVGSPSWNSTNTSDFALDSNSAVLSVNSSAAAGATTDVTVTVDGVTSNSVSYTVVSSGPVNEPVASVVLQGSTPA